MSIPTSLIVVVLVLAWLVVLVPMVARRREAVPEAEMAGGTFRVLQRSDGGARRRQAFRRQANIDTGDRNAVDADVSDDPAAADHELDDELLDDEYADGDEYGSDDDETDEYGEEYGEFDDEQSGAPAVQSAPVTAIPARGGARQSFGSHPYRPHADEVQHASSGSHPYRPADSYDDEFADDHAAAAGGRPSSTDHDDDLHLRPIPRRAGRGGYDPDAAEVARQFKYSRRRRVTVVLLLSTLLFSAAAVVVNPVMWVGTAVFGLLLVGFLAYLRRQVQIEANIRERRLARLRRARQIRPEYDFEHAESYAPAGPVPRGAVPASQVPPTGYRRGRQIVDLDDDDPAFEDLEYYQPVAYRRASGQ